LNFRKYKSGFSLIELAIGLLIVGLITAPMLTEYAAWKNSQISNFTKGNAFTVKNALMKFALNNGCYPVPATPGIASSNAAFGVEAIARTTCADITASLAAMPVCAGDDIVVCKTACTAPSATCPAGTPFILIGDVPFATLGLPKQYMVDGLGRKFTYAVSANLADNTAFNDGAGAVTVRDLNNQGPPMATGGPVTIAHYAIVSHGRDGVGAFTLGGGTLSANCAGAGVDLDNCNNDGIFNNGYTLYTDPKGVQQYDRQESTSAGATHFDDFVFYEVTTSTDIWSKSTTADIVSHSEPGNVLVKMPTSPTGPANPQAKLDVRGDLAADSIWTSALCSTDANSFASPTYTNTPCVLGGVTPNAFTPDILGKTPAAKVAGSAGIHCGKGTAAGVPAAVGVAMTGIAAADEQCVTPTNLNAQAGYAIGACAANTYPYGINAGGTLKCAPGPTAP
jgi:prepilin-type N-terminal cleavage/methylation domain-containing protein